MRLRFRPRLRHRASFPDTCDLQEVVALPISPPAPNPAALVLRLGDLPQGFSVSRADTGPVDVPPALAGKLRLWGRLGGYRVRFSRPVSVATMQEGPFEIRSEATVYRSRRGAEAALTYTTRSLIPKPFVPLPMGFPLGRQAHQYVVETSAYGVESLGYLVVWREGRVDASVSLTGRLGAVSVGDLAPFAKKQDTRIRRALLGRSR